MPSSPLPNEAGTLPDVSVTRRTSGPLYPDERRNSGALTNTGKMGLQRPDANKRNYQALVAALQTVGYSIPGFIASAVVSLDGQPIAQVTIDDLDISPMCSYFSTIMRGVLQSLDSGDWGGYEDTVITSADRRILLRLIGTDRDAFQVLVTTRESDPAESLEVMANVEGAIGAALR